MAAEGTAMHFRFLILTFAVAGACDTDRDFASNSSGSGGAAAVAGEAGADPGGNIGGTLDYAGGGSATGGAGGMSGGDGGQAGSAGSAGTETECVLGQSDFGSCIL